MTHFRFAILVFRFQKAHAVKRSAVAISFVLGVLAAPFVTEAQQPAKVPRIGLLSADAASASWHLVEAFRHGLRDLGHVEGQNITIEYRFAEGKYDRLPDLAAELVRHKVDVIKAFTTPATRAAMNATATIPIVFSQAGDPVGSGLVASLARPGANVTGVSLLAAELSVKNLELLKEIVPRISRVAVLWEPDQPVGAFFLRQTEVAAKSLRVQLQPLEVRDPNDLETAFASVTRRRAQGLIVLPGSLFNLHRHRLADLAARSRVPAIFIRREFVEAGGLMSYGTNFADVSRRAATYVDKILKGAKSADLPVEQPTRFEMVINMKTAKALGITFPPSIMVRADQVIQ